MSETYYTTFPDRMAKNLLKHLRKTRNDFISSMYQDFGLDNMPESIKIRLNSSLLSVIEISPKFKECSKKHRE